MDGDQFDQVARAFATAASRRNVFKGLAGVLAGAVGIRKLEPAAAAVCTQTEGAGCNYPPGNNCCADPFLCIGDASGGGAGHCGGCAAGTTFCFSPVHVGTCCANGTQTCFNGDCCTPLTACPGGQTCGTASDGCGGTLQCGSCPTPADPCLTASCSAGQCVNVPVDDGTACDDGNACTLGETCQAGVCTGGNPVICTAMDQCHDAGTCDPATGDCSNPNKANGTSCNDNNACTTGDACQAGVCTGGVSTVCSASDACHDVGVCDTTTGVCSNPAKPDGTGCDNGNACTQTDTCQAGVCTGGNPVVCPAPDQCHDAGTCNPDTGECTYPVKADGTSCDNGNACTVNDVCTAGVCVAGTAVVCTASDQCHDAGICNPATGICSNPPKANNTACDDGNACTIGDTCQTGICTPGAGIVCTASDQCHDAGACDTATGVCSNPAKTDGTVCNDGDLCTQIDTCQAGVCTGSNPVVCTASDQCHVAGVCDPTTGVCSNPDAIDGTLCGDGDACTQADACQAGVCTGGNPVECPPPDQCHEAGVCNPDTGQCEYAAKADNTPCDDGNACTIGDTCQAGSCTAGTAVVCVASDQCHVAGTCDPATGICSNPAKADGASCDDGDACTQLDACQSGVCVGGDPVVCIASDQCHEAGVCNPATGVCSDPTKTDGSACDDGNPCTTDETCQNGTCGGGTPVDCSNLTDPCNVGTCNGASGACEATPVKNGTSCDEVGGTCQDGVCVDPTATSTPTPTQTATATPTPTQTATATATAKVRPPHKTPTPKPTAVTPNELPITGTKDSSDSNSNTEVLEALTAIAAAAAIVAARLRHAKDETEP